MQQQLTQLATKHDKMSNVRGKGLLCAFDFPNKDMRNAFVQKGMDHNVMFLGCGNQTIRFRPALCIEKQHIDMGVEVMEKILPTL
ncbi:L-lysine-epsilon aminotransferase [compost metagenome]